VIAVSAIVVLSAGCRHDDSSEPDNVRDGDLSLFAGDSSGLQPYDSLIGLGTVIEGTVTDRRGPIPQLGINDGVIYEAGAEAITPFGLPVLVLADITVVHAVDGSETLVAAADAGQPFDILAPVGMYEVGQRYEFWAKRPNAGVTSSYLAFEIDGGPPIPGLGIPQLGEEVERLVAHTGMTRTDSLLALSLELNTTSDTEPRGPLAEFVFGSSAPHEPAPADVYPLSEVELSEGDMGLQQVEILLVGAEPGRYYSLQGKRKLGGWFMTDDHGMTTMHGYLASGETVALVVSDDGTGSETVDGSPQWTVDPSEADDGVVRVVFERGSDGQLGLASGLTRVEFSQRIEELVLGTGMTTAD
jgi:hypothetical protein